MTKETPNPEKLNAHLPFVGFVLGTYGIVADKIKEFLVLGGIFSLALSLIRLCSGTSAFCGNSSYMQQYFCTSNVFVFLFVSLAVFFIFCVFIRAWIQVIASKDKQKWSFYLTPKKSDIKILGLFFFFSLAIFIAAGSAYLLYVREPNPDWRIEMLYFTVVSLGFLFPFFVLRFFSYIAFAALDAPLPSLKEIWKKTQGSFFVMLSNLLILLVLGLFISSYALYHIVTTNDSNQFLIVFGGEYLSYMVSLLIAACFANYCYLQKKYLFERNEDGKSGN